MFITSGILITRQINTHHEKEQKALLDHALEHDGHDPNKPNAIKHGEDTHPEDYGSGGHEVISSFLVAIPRNFICSQDTRDSVKDCNQEKANKNDIEPVPELLEIEETAFVELIVRRE